MTIGLAPFEFNGKIIDTALRYDQIDLDLYDLSALSGKAFEFPPNPEQGYIDGSIYLLNRHVLFLTRRLVFGKVGEETIPLRIEGLVEFSSSGLPNFEDATLVVDTALYLPLTTGQLATIAEDAVNKADAHSPRDIGKVMAFLAKNPRADGRLAELNAEVRKILLQKT